MRKLDVDLIVRGLGPILREWTGRVLARLVAVEARVAEAGTTPGPPGADGEAGPQGLPGRDGALESLAVAYDGRRTLTLTCKDGTPIEGGIITLPIVLDAGVYAPGTTYDTGDAASYGGSLWIAQETTGALPGTTKAWRLAVKHGRDGRNGKDGAPGPDGKPGAPGRDLTQMDDKGNKWRS